ncbi:polysaccharide biosynthesis protein [Roseobacter litoralis]|uniref:NAD dependent epimerase / dehydratase-like protein n=1 Tax=Roseobacter litoralis (strain ATCC 49566 / DSM 6996 / JCM 21268 / NBRC 15278 / OCh 149) TaxID=391595 RepID=F7ZJ67_ROSLO|nr:polysaccharide biosynthesis protein [Roseobacter litoralis]AEI96312.1 NAD dependent epimerase / dehydratase-like protein [Roseobacter litoralis Och 149]
MVQRDLSSLATGRELSLFQSDINAKRPEIARIVNGARVLVIGGAGSIGSATVREILGFRPAALHVVDQNENDLAEMIRSLRSSDTLLEIPDLRSLPLDYGSVQFRAFVRNEGPYDLVLNFAAIKHVRSEKDSYSALQMFDTNIVKQARLMALLDATGFRGRYFSVSTDKAANPTSFMGASKRVMEHVMFDAGLASGLGCTITSARFANVAFSNGSLLQSFENRLKQDQPLAAPMQTRRYFVSLKESGQLCLLAATTAPHRHIVVPNLDPETALIDMQQIAEGFLVAKGYAPRQYRDEAQACAAVLADKASGHWPLLLTELSTSGEKPYEEFVAQGESCIDLGYDALSGVAYLPLADPRIMTEVMDSMQKVFENAEHAPVSKETLKALIARAEPAFLQSHKETGLNLDQRV